MDTTRLARRVAAKHLSASARWPAEIGRPPVQGRPRYYTEGTPEDDLRIDLTHALKYLAGMMRAVGAADPGGADELGRAYNKVQSMLVDALEPHVHSGRPLRLDLVAEKARDLREIAVAVGAPELGELADFFEAAFRAL